MVTEVLQYIDDKKQIRTKTERKKKNMKPTITDETISCILQLNADIGDIIDAIEYIKPIQERLQTLLTDLEQREETA